MDIHNCVPCRELIVCRMLSMSPTSVLTSCSRLSDFTFNLQILMKIQKIDIECLHFVFRG